MKTQGQGFREEFKDLQFKESQFRCIMTLQLSVLAINGGGTLTHAVAINDGPTRTSSWDDVVDEVVIGVTATHIIVDEAGSASAVPFKDVSTETLVDTFCALEKEITEGKIQIEDYSDEIK